MRLRTRLFLLFLVSGVLPLLFLLSLGWWPMRQQMRIWTLPRVETGLESSIRTNQETLDRILRSVEDTGQEVVDLASRSGRSMSEIHDILVRATQDPLVDLAYYLVPSPEGFEVMAGTGFAVDPDELARQVSYPSSSTKGPQRSRPIRWEVQGKDVLLIPSFLWNVVPSDADPQVAGCIVLGPQLGPQFFADLNNVTESLVNYRRFGEIGQIFGSAQLLMLGLALVASLITSAWLARRVARRISSPVEGLVSAMEAVGRGHDPGTPKESYIPELDLLSRTFTQMRTRLNEFEDQLRETEQVRATQETARFVAHEIRNALTPVTAGLAVLEKRVESLPSESRPQGVRALAAIRREANRMAALASSFSEYSRLPEPAPEEVDPKALLEALREEVPPGVEFTLDADAELPRIHADRDEIERLLRNLVKNAVEAMEEEGSIRITARQEQKGLRIVIEDDGPGMDEKTLARALQPGFSTKEHGSGLGLALVRRSLIRYGARLGLESELGAGTRVTIHFPIGEHGPSHGGGRSREANR